MRQHECIAVHPKFRKALKLKAAELDMSMYGFSEKLADELMDETKPQMPERRKYGFKF